MSFKAPYLNAIMSVLILVLSAFYARADKAISLEQAINLAQQNDPWLHGNQLKQRALEHRIVAAGSLAAPQVSLGIINLPTDTWNTAQQEMSQLKLGISQVLPRGDSLAIKQDQLTIESEKFPLQRLDRKARLVRKVSQLWLDAYLAQQIITLIEKDWALFEQMAEVAKASYSSGVGNTRQQDIMRAQLEIIQLEDRVASQKQLRDAAVAALNEWLYSYHGDRLHDLFNVDAQPIEYSVSTQLPSIRLNMPTQLNSANYSSNLLAQLLANHPVLLAIDVKHKALAKGVELAKQQYKSQWGVNASYAYRDDMPVGQTRSDLFSVGVTFDLPLFTQPRQAKHVAAAITEAEVVKTETFLRTKQMINALAKELSQLKRLSQRQSIYQQQLLTQVHDQAEATLTAYTNDDGDFADVVRARITVLNASISALRIDVELLKTIARINYFFTHSRFTSNATYNPLQTQQLGEH